MLKNYFARRRFVGCEEKSSAYSRDILTQGAHRRIARPVRGNPRECPHRRPEKKENPPTSPGIGQSVRGWT